MWYDDYKRKTEELSDEELGRLVRVCSDYHKDGTADISTLCDMAKGIFYCLRDNIDCDKAEYAERCARNAENGRKGAAKRRAHSDGDDSNRYQTLPTDSDCYRPIARDGESSQNKNKSENENETKKENNTWVFYAE